MFNVDTASPIIILTEMGFFDNSTAYPLLTLDN